MYLPFANRMSSSAVPRPSVTTASATPRVRTAGSAKTIPSGTVASTPTMSAAQNGKPAASTSRPAAHAPKPAIAYWASEIWPAYPVTTTIESRISATENMIVKESTQMAGASRKMSEQTPIPPSTRMGLTRPLPTDGSFCRKKSRSGIAWPRKASTRTMTMNGTDRSKPCRLKWNQSPSVESVALELHLRDADRDGREERDWEGRERRNERRRERAEHEIRHRPDLQRHDRRDEDAGEARECRPERPVQGRDQVGRAADRRCSPLVLRDGGRGEAELRVPVDVPEEDAHPAGDAEHDQPVELDERRPPEVDVVVGRGREIGRRATRRRPVPVDLRSRRGTSPTGR